MTQDEYNAIQTGDALVNQLTGNVYTVICTHFCADGSITHVAVRTITVTNPSEWEKL